MTRHPFCTTGLVGLITVALSAQQSQPAAPQRAPGTLRESVTAVLVDVVVRDKRGQPVRDLVKGDFEILEDGVRQTLDSFTPFLEGTSPAVPTTAPPQSAGSAAAGELPDTPAVMALVFDRLSPEARRLAVQAAQRYLGTQEEMRNYIGIFGLDLDLKPWVPFTRNGVIVRSALNRIATGATTGLGAADLSQQKAANEPAASPPTGPPASGAVGPGAGAAAADRASNAVAAQIAQMQANMIRDFERMARDQQGYAQTDGLFAIIRTLGRLPGRKSIVLFSEGIAIPAAVHRFFIGVIDAANRANVSIYTMDAAGLRAQSDQAAVRDQINRTAAFGINTGYSSDSGDAYTRALEGNEDTLRSDPSYGLGTLAQDTGGLLFNRSNNLADGFKRIEDDLHNYYLLGYTPTNAAFDGRFRKIAVKVNRPGTTVAARKGYLAVRDVGSSPINDWEAPALAALESKPVPNAFPVRAGALVFPERGRPGLVPVVVELKTAPLTFQPAADGKSYTSDFTVLVRFLDDQRRVVRRVSQHYEIRGELSEIERAKLGEVLFYRESELPPGVYDMETAVHDALSGKSSVRLATIEVPKFADNSLRISSVVLVKRGEAVAEKERRVDNPLQVNGVALTPNLGDPIGKSAKEVAAYFTIYPSPGTRGLDLVMIQLLQNGKVAMQVPMPAPPPDASGRIQQVARVPLDQLAPGTYDLRAVVRQGDQQVSASTFLRVVE
jgi:VWFA-related protein